MLALDARGDAAIGGQPVVALGYATGLEAVLANDGETTRTTPQARSTASATDQPVEQREEHIETPVRSVVVRQVVLSRLPQTRGKPSAQVKSPMNLPETTLNLGCGERSEFSKGVRIGRLN